LVSNNNGSVKNLIISLLPFYFNVNPVATILGEEIEEASLPKIINDELH
jgi:hypothetical protein